MDIQNKIWSFCKAKSMTDAGAAAVLGNIEAESAVKPNNVEDRCFMSDAEYTAAVDSGSYNADLFCKDAYGYGLCQWTAPPRKRLLLTMARNRGCSISDVDMQLDLMWRELTESFPALLKRLCNENNTQVLAAEFMIQFENPANQSIAAQLGRADMAMKWYNKLAHTADKSAEVTYKWVDIKLRELCKGLKGDDVETMQTMLAFKVDNELVVDKDFGAHTKAVLMRFQRENGLTADGICGKNTWSKLLGG